MSAKRSAVPLGSFIQATQLCPRLLLSRLLSTLQAMGKLFVCIRILSLSAEYFRVLILSTGSL